jgi:hypothetical protein
MGPKAVPHVHISEPHVRVTEWRFEPGAETGWRRHEADYVVVPSPDASNHQRPQYSSVKVVACPPTTLNGPSFGFPDDG